MMLNRIVCHLVKTSGPGILPRTSYLVKTSSAGIFPRSLQRKVIGNGRFYQSTINRNQPCKNIGHTYPGTGSLQLRLQVLGRTLSSDTTGKDRDGESKTEPSEPSSAANTDDKVNKASLVLTIEMPPGEKKLPPQLKAIISNKEYKFTLVDKETGKPIYLDLDQEPFLFRSPADQTKKPSTQGKDKYMDHLRAKQEFCLIDKDLKGLLTIKKRSPYTGTQFIKLYRILDLEKRAIEVWGSMDGLKQEIKRRQMSPLFWSKTDYQSKQDSSNYSQAPEEQKTTLNKLTNFFGFTGKGTGTVLSLATIVNWLIAAGKWFQWYCCRSNSVFAEAVHSTLDAFNQLILWAGYRKSLDRADDEHPYGYSYVRYITSLVCSFSFLNGSGINFYHGVSSLISMSGFDTDYTPWVLLLLISSSFLESLPLFVAYRNICETLRSEKEETSLANVFSYVFKARNPAVAVVVLEDTTAIVGNLIAASAIGLSSHLSAPAIDAAGSLLVGSLMAGFSYVIFKSNMNILIGRSISEKEKKNMISLLENDEVVSSVHDVKAIDLGEAESGGVRLKAEINYNGEAITKELLEDLLEDRQLWMELDSITGAQGEQREFLIKFGAQVVDKLGMETDRIEENLKMKHKNIRHIDLESL